MKKHTAVYLDHFYNGDTTAFVLCEKCFVEGIEAQANDTHHIGGRRSGGSKLLDIPEKLMAVCRKCHDDLEKMDFIDQALIHIAFCGIVKIRIDKSLCKKSLFEITQDFKNGKQTRISHR